MPSAPANFDALLAGYVTCCSMMDDLRRFAPHIQAGLAKIIDPMIKGRAEDPASVPWTSPPG
jgi:hypothetical protein